MGEILLVSDEFGPKDCGEGCISVREERCGDGHGSASSFAMNGWD